MESVLFCTPLNLDHDTVCEFLRHQDELSYYNRTFVAKSANSGALSESLGGHEPVPVIYVG